MNASTMPLTREEQQRLALTHPFARANAHLGREFIRTLGGGWSVGLSVNK